MPTTSWDLFDTLIGRRCGTPERIWLQVAERLHMESPSEFVKIRREAEKQCQNKGGEYTLQDIYSHTTIPDAWMVEFSVELDNVFRIDQYASKLHDSHTIISDMYMSEDMLRAMIAKAGIKFNGKIIVSCRGKRDGTSWAGYVNKGRHVHTGDNPETDIRIPKSLGLVTQTARTGMTAMEKRAMELSEDLAWWMRYCRLSSSFEDQLMIIEAELNMPILWLFSQVLNDYCHRNGIEVLNFMARDCFLFQKMFDRMFGDTVKSNYIMASRDCFLRRSDSYVKYFNKINVENSALVDLSASFGSLAGFASIAAKKITAWTGIFLTHPFLADTSTINFEYMFTNTQVHLNNTSLEMLNYAPHWHVADVTEDEKPVFDNENEYSLARVKSVTDECARMISVAPKERIPVSLARIMLIDLFADLQGRLPFVKSQYPNHHLIEAKREPGTKVYAKKAEPHPIILTSAKGYNYADLVPFLGSLHKAGFLGKIVIIDYGLEKVTVDRLLKCGLSVSLIPGTMVNGQVVVDRFSAYADFSGSVPDDQWIVACDISDIVFQSDPQTFLEQRARKVNVVAAQEGIRFSGNRWVRENLLHYYPEWEFLLDLPLINAGSLAVRAGVFTTLCANVFAKCQEKPHAQKHDQVVMNYLIRKNIGGLSVLETQASGSWCYNGAASMFAIEEDRRNFFDVMPVVKNGLCITDEGVPVMFHHYTRDRLLKPIIQSRYRL